MSWLSGLAGKAEDLLNKLDQNAAIALQKGPEPQIAVDDSVLVEVNSQGGSFAPKRTTVTNNSACREGVFKSLPAVKSYPNLASSIGASDISENSGKLRSSVAAADDDELMRFLNSPKAEIKTRKINEANDYVGDEGFSLKSTSQQIIPIASKISKSKRNLEVEVISALRQSKDDSSIEVPDGSDAVEELNLVPSYDVMRRELMAKEQEVLASQKKLKESQQEVDELRNRLTSMEMHLMEVQNMYARGIEDSKKIAEAAIAGRFQAESELDRLKNEFSYSMDDKTRALELLKSKMEGELVATNNKSSSLQRRYELLVEELRNERMEQERYRARAQAVLAGRDREIAELRARGMAVSEHSADSEAHEFERQKEQQMWEEEVLKLREEVARVHCVAEEARRQWEGERECVEDDLLAERGRREAAEEQEKATLQELRSLRAEVDRLRQRELELRQREEEEECKGGARRGEWQGGGRARVMAQDVAVDDGVSERLAALTSTLIEKQIRVESLTAERNALRLQLEKTDHLYRDAIAHLGQGASSSMPGQNDTDDVKARIPSFLLESPFDTAVARKVKRAYSSLDSVGVRVGIFLRRYPLARTLLLSYTVLLHLWVVVVLLTYTPDVH